MLPRAGVLKILTTPFARRTFLRSTLFGGAAAFAQDSGAPITETRYGKLRGLASNGVSIFRGIPYGGPTEGARRFQPPSKPQKWAGVRDATETGPRCVQGPGNIFLSPVIGEYFGGGRKDRVELARQTDSENCLVLNVLTPGLRGKRPVMVYIHGGGFTGGSSMLTLFADAFPRENDVVLVGVNHRINLFGYLYLGEFGAQYADSGNVGQLDLIAALEWVRDNIAAFGGDPHNVTIFGESGGAAKISTLTAMPAAKGLYHKAILESGSTLRVATKEEATQTARTVLGKLGVGADKLDALTGMSAAQIYSAFGQGLRVSPVVDGRSLPSQPWDPKAPAISAHIPMIIGTCKDESTLFSLQDSALFSLDEAALRERVIKAGMPEAEVDHLIGLYRKEHPKDSPTDIYFRIASDRGVRRNAILQAERQLEQAKAPVYMYYFTWHTPLAEGRIKAFHTAELPLAMRLVRYPESEQLSKQIAGAWATFARRGNPNHAGLPDWPAYTTAQRATMLFDNPSTVVKDPDGAARERLRERPSGRPL